MEKTIYPLKTGEQQAALREAHNAAVARARETGQLIAWCTGQAPIDILRAADIVPYFPENISCLGAARGMGSDLCQIAEEHGFSPELCSYGRINLGIILSEWQKSPAKVPRPDLLYCPSTCQTHLKWFEELSRQLHVPLLVLDLPQVHNTGDGEYVAAATEYARRQLQEHVAFLEELTGRPLDNARLEEVVAAGARAGRLWGEIIAMAKQRPSPITVFDLFVHFGPLSLYRGLNETVTYYQQLLEEVQERVRQGFSAVGEERYRLCWDGIPAWFRLGFLGRTLARHGACCVVCEQVYPWVEFMETLDPRRPLESIATAQLFYHINLGADHRIERLVRELQDSAVEGIVVQSDRTCKTVHGDQLARMRVIQERLNIPVVAVEGDMCDQRLFHEADATARIETFLELLTKRQGLTV